MVRCTRHCQRQRWHSHDASRQADSCPVGIPAVRLSTASENWIQLPSVDIAGIAAGAASLLGAGHWFRSKQSWRVTGLRESPADLSSSAADAVNVRRPPERLAHSPLSRTATGWLSARRSGPGGSTCPPGRCQSDTTPCAAKLRCHQTAPRNSPAPTQRQPVTASLIRLGALVLAADRPSRPGPPGHPPRRNSARTSPSTSGTAAGNAARAAPGPAPSRPRRSRQHRPDPAPPSSTRPPPASSAR